jgi:tetratricopeptide (TPR) repeat protein
MMYFLAFAQDRQRTLESLEEESTRINQLLTGYAAKQRHTVYFLPNADLNALREALIQHADSIWLFHYGGHATTQHLALEDNPARAEGLAGLLGQCKQLKVAILNGCSTKGQVQRLLNAGVPLVIATSAPVGDRKATDFAKAFYSALCHGKTINEAFETGISAARLQENTAVDRGLDVEEMERHPDGAERWGIYCQSHHAYIKGIRLPGAGGSEHNESPNLPAPTRLFGRDELFEQLSQLLLHTPSARLLLGGGPGIGKSALSLALLHDKRISARYGHRRYFARCDAATGKDLLTAELSKALGISPGPDKEARTRQALAEAPALLVVDNAETPWQGDQHGAEEWLDYLHSLPGLALVVTIRGQERPLDIPWHASPILTPLDNDNAKAVFLEIAGRHLAQDPLLDTIVAPLGGLPLALSLMAHQAQGEPDLQLLYQRWQAQRTAMLNKGVGDDRRNNLALSLEQSVQSPRMTDAGRRLFCLMGILPDGIHREDLEGAAPDYGLPGARELVNNGLAYYDRYRLLTLAPVREYARSTYQPSPEDLESSVHYFLKLTQISDKLETKEAHEAITKFASEWNNFEAMIYKSLQLPSWKNGVSAVDAISRYSSLTGIGNNDLIREAIQKLDSELVNILRFRFFIRLLNFIYPKCEYLKILRWKANIIYRDGELALYRSDTSKACEQFIIALKIYNQIGCILGQANSIKGLGNIYLRHSKNNKALKSFEQALNLYKQIGHKNGQANCISSLGEIAMREKEYSLASSKYEQAFLLYKETNLLFGQVNVIYKQGEIALKQSEIELADKKYKEALLIYEQIGDILGQANSTLGLAKIAYELSDYETSINKIEQALQLYKKVNDKFGQANCFQCLGEIAQMRHNLDTAKKQWIEALNLYQQIPEPYSIGMTNLLLARSTDKQERNVYIEAARVAWSKIGREDLIAELDEEFGNE